MPYESAKFCLEQAGITPADVDIVAIPFAPISIFEKARWHYAKRYWYAPDRSLDAILMGNRRYHRDRKSTRLNSSHVRISYAVFCYSVRYLESFPTRRSSDLALRVGQILPGAGRNHSGGRGYRRHSLRTHQHLREGALALRQALLVCA